MLYLAWLPLLSFRGLISNYFLIDTLLLTFFINCLMLFDLFLDLNKNKMRVEYIVLFLILSIFIVALNKQALAFFDIILAVYLLRKVSIDYFIKYASIIALINLFFIIVCIFYSVKPNELVWMPKGEAYTLGFNNTNVASAFFMINVMIIVLWVYTKNKFLTFLFIPLFYFIYTLTLGRTSFISEMFFYIAYIFNFIKFNIFFSRFIPIVFYILTFFLTYYSRIFSWINETFTGRFFIYDSILSNFNLFNLFFGYKIPAGAAMDSSFLALLFDGGIIFVLVFLYLYENYYKNNLSKANYFYFPFIVFMMVGGFSENIFSSFNLLSIIFFKILYEKKQNKISL